MNEINGMPVLPDWREVCKVLNAADAKVMILHDEEDGLAVIYRMCGSKFLPDKVVPNDVVSFLIQTGFLEESQAGGTNDRRSGLVLSSKGWEYLKTHDQHGKPQPCNEAYVWTHVWRGGNITFREPDKDGNYPKNFRW